jgi:hypothetical protein
MKLPLLGTNKTGRTPSWLQILGIHNLVGHLFFTVRCNILHDCVDLNINDDRSVKLFAEPHLACTDLDGIIDSSPFNLALDHDLFFIDRLDVLLIGGRINLVICQELQPLKN